MDVSNRIDAVRARLRESGLDAFAARSAPNVSYLTGFDAVWDSDPSALVLISHDTAIVVTDSRYCEAAAAAAGEGPMMVRVASGDPWAVVSESLGSRSLASVAIESSAPYALVLRLRDLLTADVVPVDDWVETLRCSKDEAEIARIEEAQAITDAAFAHILEFVSEGMTEVQIALELEVFMRTHGSEGVAFPPIVASGANSALPHAHPGARVVQRGDFVKMDFGARVGGYCSDMTRTVVMGKPSARQGEIYKTVLSANLAGIGAVRSGLPGCEIDAVARKVIEDAGFARNFGHGLGHGVGLEVHELPNLGPRSTGAVPVGSVVTIEPGVYVPGFGGVRIEDLVVVEKAGARVLTRSTKELIEV